MILLKPVFIIAIVAVAMIGMMVPSAFAMDIASFVDQSKDPQHYIDRYNNEPAYKEWFDENYPQYSSIYDAVGMEKPIMPVTIELSNISVTKINERSATIEIAFEISNPNPRAVIIQTMDFNLFETGFSSYEQFAGGTIGSGPEGMVEFGSNYYAVLGDNTIVLKKKMTMKNTSTSSELWDTLESENKYYNCIAKEIADCESGSASWWVYGTVYFNLSSMTSGQENTVPFEFFLDTPTTNNDKLLKTQDTEIEIAPEIILEISPEIDSEITPEPTPEPTPESTINYSASLIAYFEDKNRKSMLMNLDQYPSNIFEFETLFDVLKDRGYGEGNLPSEAEWTKINRDEAGNFMKYKLAQQLYNMDIIIDDIKDRIKKLDISQSEKDSTMIDFEYHTNNVRHNTIQSLIGELAQVNSVLSIQQETNEQILKDVSNYYNDIKVENNPWTESTIEQNSPPNDGGCLIATATYGSEMATEVQQLRELRDNQLLQTESGSAFMETFNDIYYSFSPIIADYERENPYFKEAVKLAITPMISTLSLMENANSESEVLSIGISVIMLNLGMYLGVPAIVIVGIRKIK